MMFALFKKLVPRSLYGRAALILAVPILTLQLVVSAAFLQRHFEGVTRQMTNSLAVELQFVFDEIRAGGLWAGRRVAEPLGLTLNPEIPKPFTGDLPEDRLFYDLSGRVVIGVLRANRPEITWIDLKTDDNIVVFGIDLGAAGRFVMELPRRRVSASNPHQLLVLMVFTGGLMTGVAYLFLRNQLRPIRRLANAAEEFGKGRIVDYSPAGAQEVRSAGRAFLDMRQRIENQIEQRTMMLSGVSHDLRTPLTRMKLALSMMEPNADHAALARDVDEMEALLTAFLDFARGDALDDVQEVDLNAFLSGLVADMTRGGGAEIVLTLPQEAVLVELRPQAIRRVLDNLVNNALRYGGRAALSLTVTPRQIRLSVEDDGPGIPPDQREAALRPFVRLDAARNQDRGSGVGLGLAIAQDIARRHGGKLILGASAQWGGLKAEVILPR